MKSYDVIILGAGPGGLTAGIYAARAGLKTAVISKDIGGTATSIVKLENWPGFHGTGPELIQNIYEHLKEYKVDIILDEINLIEKKGKGFIIHSKKKNVEGKTVIITTGKGRRKLNIPGEKKLTGKGVSYCVMCDGFFFKDKITAVIGGSDSALMSALSLSDIAEKVYIIYRGERLRDGKLTVKKVQKKKNIETIYNAIPTKILGNKKVEKIVFDIKGKEKTLDVDGIFVEIGSIPLMEFAKKLNLKLDEEDNIIVDDEMKTSVPGIFAAGDVTNSKTKQVVVASSQGAIAVKGVMDFLKMRIR
ncbi:MAG: FAD-dependent oxidoreductase [Nanoarchaeota archaeon]|nr:FAD-dependent oxidoreductase [Nanoarchaeota archaeon]